ncbi:hypothetical protein B0H10DRAFT_2209748 [Mycena sp. CBHHK59/15]|nr:hypothetical protein B0H10DRAFT_2209748 [Mycena sp. CBHHK59/15]
MLSGWLPRRRQHLTTPRPRHYHIKPNGTYMSVVSTVQNYILEHGEDLHLAVYKTDLIVKKITDKLLADAYNNLKSAFRKLHHLPIIPDIVPQSILAAVALMHKVAGPLAVVTNKKGANTGFWPKLENELDALYKEYGSHRKSAAWLEWEKNIIADNKTKYDRGNRGRDAATGREELDLAAGLGEPLTGDTGGGYTAGININALGDIAATTES